MLSLIIGGSGSGKSEYAEQLACAGAAPKIYLATMQIWDDECRARVEKHRRQRAGRGFTTVECPLHLYDLPLPEISSVILLEDLGNLAANELYDPAGAGLRAYDQIMNGILRLADKNDVIVVSNELFTGGSCYAGDTQSYLQLMAALHRSLAAHADAVCEVVNTCPFYYKGVQRL